jgi:hypothetical protein
MVFIIQLSWVLYYSTMPGSTGEGALLRMNFKIPEGADTRSALDHCHTQVSKSIFSFLSLLQEQSNFSKVTCLSRQTDQLTGGGGGGKWTLIKITEQSAPSFSSRSLSPLHHRLESHNQQNQRGMLWRLLHTPRLSTAFNLRTSLGNAGVPRPSSGVLQVLGEHVSDGINDDHARMAKQRWFLFLCSFAFPTFHKYLSFYEKVILNSATRLLTKILILWTNILENMLF